MIGDRQAGQRDSDRDREKTRFMENKLKVVGIGDWLVANGPGDIIRTYALGSCVALVLHHPATKTCGMIHIALPDSFSHPEAAQRGEGYYADTGVPKLLAEMTKQAGLFMAGGSGMVAKLAGGANVIKVKTGYNIGERIVQVVEDLLGQAQIPIVAADVGGAISRTVSVHIDTGEVIINSPGKPERLLK